MSRLHRRTALAATAIATLLWTLPASADTTLLNVSYDPTRELYQDFNKAFADALEAEDRRDGHHPAVARRLGQAGPRRDRRARRRRRHAGAGRRHRRHRRQDRQAAQGLAEPAAQQQLALHLDHRVPRPQGQPQGHQGLGRPRQAGRRGDHAQPEDLGRRALELSRRLWLGARPVRRRRGQGQGLSRRPVPQRAGARHGCPRLDHHLRPARPRRRAARLGERGVPGAQRVRRRQVRDRGAHREHPGRAAGGGGRRQCRRQGHAQGGRGLSRVPLLARRARRWPPSTTTGRASPS